MSETRFQNTETALKNQQASIQGLETQISQLSKLISERPQGSLPSNTEPNPREHLNAISTQDKEGFIAPEPELMQETVVSKGERTLRVGEETITLQARNSGITSNIEGNSPHQSTKTDNITLHKLSFKEVHEPCSRNDRGHIHEERRLRIEKLDEWRAHKLRTHDKSKLHQNKPDTSPHQLKVGDKVLLDAIHPHIVTTTPNEEIPLMVLSIFPFGTVEVSHPKFNTFKHTWPGTRVCLKPWQSRRRDTIVRYGRVEAGHDFPKTRDVINPHGRATWPWVNLIGEHGCGTGKTRACQGQGSILFLRHGHETLSSLDGSRSCSATIPHPCVLGVYGTWPCPTIIPSFVRFSHTRVLGTTPVYCCLRLHGTGVSPARVEEIESSLTSGAQRCQHMKPPHELDERVVVAELVGPRVVGGDIMRNILVGLLLSRLCDTILGRVGSSAPLDHSDAKHARDALWRHLANEGEG
ncbi:hypothetical protein GOBAR_AA10418 [Gossypium barbadense]|uniref:Uncharacterized protein n=1 Tax=Gossypium barbadense TaxID=3634 RepID=A0A2P5Y3V1_GOSBA|nr:hypothetical protein GOBAR_AA10418 [Gossypium barbadense]